MYLDLCRKKFEISKISIKNFQLALKVAHLVEFEKVWLQINMTIKETRIARKPSRRCETSFLVRGFRAYDFDENGREKRIEN